MLSSKLSHEQSLHLKHVSVVLQIHVDIYCQKQCFLSCEFLNNASRQEI
jgi:hypothetical protein